MQIPRWFTALFVCIMLTVCGIIAWQAPMQYALYEEMEDLSLKLDTSRQRERKQQVEYDAAASALPQAMATLAALQPQANAAQAQESELRQQRKQLRAEVATLEEAASQPLPLDVIASHQALLAALWEQANTMAADIGAMQQELNTLTLLLGEEGTALHQGENGGD